MEPSEPGYQPQHSMPELKRFGDYGVENARSETSMPLNSEDGPAMPQLTLYGDVSQREERKPLSSSIDNSPPSLQNSNSMYKTNGGESTQNYWQDNGYQNGGYNKILNPQPHVSDKLLKVN